MKNLLERYPVLARLPEDLRAGYAAKADAGLPLSADEVEAMGLARCEALVLIPVCGPTPVIESVFPGDMRVMGEFLRKVAYERV